MAPLMWRSFWIVLNPMLQSALDDFLNRIEADGYEPRFINKHIMQNGDVSVTVTARKKDA